MKRLLSVRSAATGERCGFVLIVVLVLVTLVAFAGFAFVNTMTNEYRGVHAHGDLLAAEQVLASAELMLCRVLEQSDDVTTIGSQRPAPQMPIPDNADATERVNVGGSAFAGFEPLSSNAGGWEHGSQQFREQLLLPARREDSGQPDPLAWRFSIVSPATHDERYAEATAGVRFGVENESARLNLSTVLTFDDIAQGSSRRALMALPGMTEAAADAILDWLDADDQPREFGAEVDEYNALPNPIRPRNGVPRMLEELLLVSGVNRAQLFGPDANRNFIVDSHEQRARQLLTTMEAGGLDPETERQGWADFLTLHSAERNVNRFGRPRVDLNQPDTGRLRRELSEFFPADVVDFVLAYRQFGPQDNARSAARATSDSTASHEGVRFPLASVADLIDARVMVVPDGETSHVVPSPLTPSSRELLALLFDRTTADSRAVTPGRINVNRAPRAVLEAIPGLSPEAAERISSRRAGFDDELLQTPAWLLTEQLLSVGEFRNVLPFVTTGGDVYRAQIVAWRPIGGPYRRAEVLIDATRRPVRRIERKDLSAFGIGFPIARLSASIEGTGPWTSNP